jgi:ornithine cyclodeaminase/alanine dehydrogenase-like protein (mu-crystallin family)
MTTAGVQEAVAGADIVCALTSSGRADPKGPLVRPGIHLDLVGSSYPGTAEVDNDLVARSRLIADSREGVLVQGAEFLRPEIGQVLGGEIERRRSNAAVLRPRHCCGE